MPPIEFATLHGSDTEDMRSKALGAFKGNPPRILPLDWQFGIKPADGAFCHEEALRPKSICRADLGFQGTLLFGRVCVKDLFLFAY